MTKKMRYVTGIVGALTLLFWGGQTFAAENIWYDLSSNCLSYQRQASYDGICETTYGPYGHSGAAWFTSGVDFGLGAESTCTVTVKASYNGDQYNEVAYITLNSGTSAEKTVATFDQGGTLVSGIDVTLGTFTIPTGQNTIFMRGQSDNPWSDSIHFYDIKVSSCTAISPPVNGSCGSADGVTSCAAPTANLCSSGSASSVSSSSSTHSWSCYGSNGGSTASCSAPKSCSAVCGNSVIETGETCDDGNTTSGDGCSSSCQSETSTCGNGVTEFDESCDDGNTTSGDGCSSSCQIEAGGSCSGASFTDSATLNFVDGCVPSESHVKGSWQTLCEHVEGGGTTESNHSWFRSDLDFGSPYDQASCTVTVTANYASNESNEDSQLEINGTTAYIYDQGGGTVTMNLGVFTITSGDNTIYASGYRPGDPWAYSTQFKTIALSSCTELNPPVCQECGNSIVEGTEQCDDGDNGDYTDGCLINCQAASCGDGYVYQGVEECDDGNTTNGDGCDASCNVETVVGACGGAEDVTACSAPGSNLCLAGASTTPQYNTTSRRWEWTCGAQSCSAKKRCLFNESAP